MTLVGVLQSALTVLFTLAGATKLTTPYERFVGLPFQGWATDFQPAQIRLIGAFEVCVAAISVVSLIWGAAHAMGVAAPVAMALVMAGAMSTHFRRGEYANIVGNMTWLAAALFVAGARYRDLIIT